MNIAGIDYGSKMAGTTVVAFIEKSKLHFHASGKKQDADQLILDWTATHKPDTIFLDAPLSLPGVYRFPEQYSNYFYRAADQELSAMSPMFLGGLTARAMKLKAALKRKSVSVKEVYPGGLAKILKLDNKRYKKDKTYLPTATTLAMDNLPGIKLNAPPVNWHEFDALLAFICGFRFEKGVHETYGTEEEKARLFYKFA